MNVPPTLPESPQTARTRRRRRWPWLLGIVGSLLLLAALAAWIHISRAQRDFDLATQAVLARQPVVNGHLGALRDVEPIATPEKDRTIGGAHSYRLQGDSGAGIVTARFDPADAAHLRIAQGVLRTDDGLAYPLFESSDGTDAASAGASRDDPVRPRMEYLRDHQSTHEYPNIIVDIDSSSRSDLELVQYARRRLIAPLAQIENVVCIYSMGAQASQPIWLLQLNQERMAALNLSVQDVRDALLADHFQLLPVAAGGETYAWPDSGHDPHSPNDILTSLQLKPMDAPAVPLGQIAQITASTDAPRQALGLITSAATHGDPAPVIAQARVAMASRALPDIQLDVHASNQLRLRLVP